MNHQILQIYLPAFLVLYLLVSFIIPTYRTYKQTGINPITFGKNDTAHDYIGFVMKGLIGLLFLAVLLFSLGPKIYYYSSPIQFLEHQILQWVGLILAHLSLVWIAIAQYQMSNSWRIGIDEVNITVLKTTGIFSISRNPIFLGMIATVTGLFCIIPNAVTFFTALGSYIIIQIQIRLEEQFLTSIHGEKYLAYKLKTKRLL
ncbi:MAG: isoprenylcysteine carboxylmethyltransferase family protein [Bacteroidota bacterium]